MANTPEVSNWGTLRLAPATRRLAPATRRLAPATRRLAPATRSNPIPNVEPANRCPWPADDPLMLAYHDHEWGFMRATGMVNDHLVTCFRHAELRRIGRQTHHAACGVGGLSVGK